MVLGCQTFDASWSASWIFVDKSLEMVLVGGACYKSFSPKKPCWRPDGKIALVLWGGRRWVVCVALACPKKHVGWGGIKLSLRVQKLVVFPG